MGELRERDTRFTYDHVDAHLCSKIIYYDPIRFVLSDESLLMFKGSDTIQRSILLFYHPSAHIFNKCSFLRLSSSKSNCTG